MVALRELSCTIPSAGTRRKLRENGRLKGLEFRRNMTSEQVKSIIVGSFPTLTVNTATFLKYGSSNTVHTIITQMERGVTHSCKQGECVFGERNGKWCTCRVCVRMCVYDRCMCADTFKWNYMYVDLHTTRAVQCHVCTQTGVQKLRYYMGWITEH